jgi:mono/diheme cytochrome c family protein
MRSGEKYDAARVRTLGVLIATASAALVLGACGTEGVSVSGDDADAQAGAELFATHCSGCHTIAAAGTQGSGNRSLRVQGPNFDQRKESYDDVLFAIHNGGFSGAIMPQNIVVGDEAAQVATFLEKYSGSDVTEPPRPSPSNSAGQQSATDPNSVNSAESSQEGAADSNSQSGSSDSGSSDSGSSDSQ